LGLVDGCVESCCALASFEFHCWRLACARARKYVGPVVAWTWRLPHLHLTLAEPCHVSRSHIHDYSLLESLPLSTEHIHTYELEHDHARDNLVFQAWTSPRLWLDKISPRVRMTSLASVLVALIRERRGLIFPKMFINTSLSTSPASSRLVRPPVRWEASCATRVDTYVFGILSTA
jgi:hypothetical protein